MNGILELMMVFLILIIISVVALLFVRLVLNLKWELSIVVACFVFSACVVLWRYFIFSR